MKKGTRKKRIPFSPPLSEEGYFRWFERCLFISNMLTRSLPPKIGLSVESAMISRLFCGFCRLFFRMWSHTFETTWLRGSGWLPVILARSADGVTGRASPPPALRPVPCAIRPSCCSLLGRAQVDALCNAVAEGESAKLHPKRNDPIAGVVSDVGPAAVRNARTQAPFLHDFRFVMAKFGVVGQDVADPSEANVLRSADVGACSHMEHGPVDPVQLFADFLDQQIDAGEIRLERRSEEARKDREVEGHRGPFERRLERSEFAADEPVQRPLNRRRAIFQAMIAAAPNDVLRHRTPRDIQSGLVETREEEARVAVAHVHLAPRGLGQVGKRSFRDPV